MNILALDTCLGACSVAVGWRSARGELLIREDCLEGEGAGAERLLSMLADVMTGAGLAFSDIDRIAVTLGPGTFTGVRTGIAAARALALAHGAETVGLPSLVVMAHRAHLLLGDRREGKRLLVAVDARRGALYVQHFGDNAGDALGPPAMLDADAALDLIGAGPTIVVGSGAPLLAAAAGKRGRTLETRLEALLPHARALVLLAPILAPMSPLVPLYLRAPDAKPQAGKALARQP